MKSSDLKYLVQTHCPDSHFFDRKTMQFFGDTMANYGVMPANVKRYDGSVVECWELFRRKAVKHGLKSSAFFDCKTFQQIHGDKAQS